MSDSLQPHELQPARFLCPSLSPGVCSNSCPLSRWHYLTISSSTAPISFHLQSFSASGSFPVSRLFTSGGQNTGASASASVLLMNIQGWFPLGLTGLISLKSTELSRVFSSTIIWKHQFFSTQAFFIVQLSYLYMTAGKIKFLLQSKNSTSVCWQHYHLQILTQLTKYTASVLRFWLPWGVIWISYENINQMQC